MQPPLLENIELTEENHIRSLSFSSKHAKFLTNTEKWENIPKFCVITGPNGSGKSHLLEYANLCLNQKKSDHYRHLYFPSNYENTTIRGSQDNSSIKRLIIGDIWKLVQEETIIENLMDSLREKLVEGHFFHYHTNPKFNQLLDDLKSSANGEVDGRPKLKVIEDLIDNYFLYYVSDDASINLLNSVLFSYNEKFTSYMNQNSKAAELTDYALQNRKQLFPGVYPDDITMIRDFQKIQDKVQLEYLKSKVAKDLGESPLKEINAILQTYGFHFQIKQNKDRSEPCKLLLQRKDVENSPEIMPDNLSSGEKKILEILAWYFYYSFHKTYDEKRVRIMLLDEPDRHLDPKLLNVFLKILHDELAGERNVQIIMTSHRPDTISLVNDKNIFLLYRMTGITASKIAPVSQRQALYQLTRNLRDLASIQIKVYTEGTSDADFYCGIYHSLLEVSNEQRALGHKKWKFKEGEPEDLLSRRYELLFVPASYDGGFGGGWTSVKACVLRDQNILENKQRAKKRQTQLISDIRAYNSLGIVDNDNDRHNEAFKLEGLDKRIAIPSERYSLENFILDPIILCLSLEEEDFAEFLPLSGSGKILEKNEISESYVDENKNGDPNDNEMPENCVDENNHAGENENLNENDGSKGESDDFLACFAVEEAKKNTEAPEEKNQKRLVAICQNIKNQLQILEDKWREEKINNKQTTNPNTEILQASLNQYFEFIEKDLKVYERYSSILDSFEDKKKKREEDAKNKKKQKAEERGDKSKFKIIASNDETKAEDLTEEKPQKLPGGLGPVKYLALNGFNQMFSVQYPKNLLKIRGHDLAEVGMEFIGEKSKISKFVSKLASNIYGNGLTVIPEELINTIFKLNKLAKEQNREDKPYKIRQINNLNQ